MSEENQNQTENNQSQPKAAQTKASWQDIVTAVVGILAILGFGWFIIFLVQKAADPNFNEIAWTRLTYLLTGVEAIAFAAAGYFFGKEVHRKQAENAEERAENASEQAADAEKRATQAEEKGRSIRTALETALPKPSRASADSRIEGFGVADDTDYSSLVEFARKLFPD